MDASTVSFLLEHKNYHALTGDVFYRDPAIANLLVGAVRDHRINPNIATNLEGDVYAISHILSFLEQWVLAEDLVVDIEAVTSLRDYNNGIASRQVENIASLYRVIELPPHLTRDVHSRLESLQDLSENVGGVFEYLATHGWADLESRLRDTVLWGSLGSTANTPLRAMFYLEVSNELGIPLLIHPQKTKYLQAAQVSIFELAKHYLGVSRAVVNASSSLHLESMVIPPIADSILHLARSERLSLLDAARNIKASSDMRSFRELVNELHLLEASKRNIEKKRKIKVAALNIADSIEREIQPNGFVSRREINIAELPAIGNLLKIIGARKIKVPDVELWEKPYIAMFNRWANELP